MRTKQDLGTILWAIDESMGMNLQALYSSSDVQFKTQTWKLCKKKECIIIFGQGAMYSKSGRVQGSSSRARNSKGRAQHPQKYA